MHKHSPSWILLISLYVTLTGCSFFTPDEDPIFFKASVPDKPLINQAPSQDDCQLKCGSKSGLKKKLCLKKCQLAAKKNASTQDSSPQSPSSTPTQP